MAGRIVDIMPEHALYAEVFGGAGNVLLRKPIEKSRIEIYNDLNSDLVNFFRVIQDPDTRKILCERCSRTPTSRELFYEHFDTLPETEGRIERAYKFYYVARGCFSGLQDHRSWGYNVTEIGGRDKAHTWIRAVENLEELGQRIRRVQLDHIDWRVAFERYDHESTLFYLDPPYVPETRRSGEYTNEMTMADHEELIDTLLHEIKGKVILSGYPNDTYKPLEHAAWYHEDHTVICETGNNERGRTKKDAEQRERTERLWTNFLPRSYKTGGRRQSIETKRKIAAARLGKKHTRETKRKIAKARRSQVKLRQLDQQQADATPKPTSAPPQRQIS